LDVPAVALGVTFCATVEALSLLRPCVSPRFQPFEIRLCLWAATTSPAPPPLRAPPLRLAEGLLRSPRVLASLTSLAPGLTRAFCPRATILPLRPIKFVFLQARVLRFLSLRFRNSFVTNLFDFFLPGRPFLLAAGVALRPLPSHHPIPPQASVVCEFYVCFFLTFDCFLRPVCDACRRVYFLRFSFPGFGCRGLTPISL